MVAYLSGEAYGGVVPADPGRIHLEGMTARVALEEAREQVAGLVGARSREVVFTSGATEAIAPRPGARWLEPAAPATSVRGRRRALGGAGRVGRVRRGPRRRRSRPSASTASGASTPPS